MSASRLLGDQSVSGLANEAPSAGSASSKAAGSHRTRAGAYVTGLASWANVSSPMPMALMSPEMGRPVVRSRPSMSDGSSR